MQKLLYVQSFYFSLKKNISHIFCGGKGCLKCSGQPFSSVDTYFEKFLEMNITLTVLVDDAVQPQLSLMLC